VSIDAPSYETRQLGAEGHVMKPFRRSQLEQAIELALSPAPEVLEVRR
jgi:DNA-binding NarL/FixJ family response regulator